MIIKIQSDDGQDIAIQCGEQTGSISIGIWHCRKPQTDLEHFTIEEAKAAIAALEFAIKIAEEERDYMEKRNGN